MLLSLHSDFRDYYDAEFHEHKKTGSTTTFTRQSSRTPREETLRYLTQYTDTLLFPQVVPHGFASSFQDTPVVVYLDPFSTNSYNLHLTDSPSSYKTKYATAFLDNRGTSLRHIVVGRHNYLFRVASKNNWKSDVGDVSIALENTWEAELHPHLPLYSVTYISGADDKLYALRLNTAPKLSMYLPPLLPGVEVYNSISTWYEKER